MLDNNAGIGYSIPICFSIRFKIYGYRLKLALHSPKCIHGKKGGDIYAEAKKSCRKIGRKRRRN